jgi:hypothetical protein
MRRCETIIFQIFLLGAVSSVFANETGSNVFPESIGASYIELYAADKTGLPLEELRREYEHVLEPVQHLYKKHKRK